VKPPHVDDTAAGGAIVNVSSGAARMGSPGDDADYAVERRAQLDDDRTVP
jgi:hypothetical protein